MLFVTAILATPFGQEQQSQSTTNVLPQPSEQLVKDFENTYGFFIQLGTFITEARKLNGQNISCKDIPQSDRDAFDKALNDIPGYTPPATCKTAGLDALCGVATMTEANYAKIVTCGDALGDVFDAINDGDLETEAGKFVDCVKVATDATSFALCSAPVVAGFATYKTAFTCIGSNPTIAGSIEHCAESSTKTAMNNVFAELNKLPDIMKTLAKENVDTTKFKDSADSLKTFDTTMDTEKKALNEESEKAAKSAGVGASFVSVQAGTVLAVVASALAIFLA